MRLIFFTLMSAVIFNINVLDVNAQASQGEIFNGNRLSIVSIEVAPDAADPNRQPVRGSGFIIGQGGYILTARHIVSGYINESTTPITVRIGSLNGITARADLHPINLGVDVALLKLPNPIGLGLSSYNVTKRGEAAKRSTGDKLYVIGFNSNSNISIQEAALSSNFGGGIAGNFQWEITAPGTVFGMSGAPVFDDQGSVVGIVQGGRPGTSIVLVWPEEHLEGFAAIAGWMRTSVPIPLKSCRDPSHGVERYTKNIEVLKTSPEMGGGHGQDEWCQNAISILRGEFLNAEFERISSSETSRSHCSPFNCPQYTYMCTIRVKADPIYIDKISNACR